MLEAAGAYSVSYVTMTRLRGEPLAQPGCFALLKALCDLGYKVSLETSRALDISAVDPSGNKKS